MNKQMGFRKWLQIAVLAPAGMAMFGSAAHASVTLPPRKPGFWVTTMHMGMHMVMNGQTINDPGLAPTISAMCANAATDAFEMQRMNGGMGHCTGFDIEQAGSAYTISGSCASPMGNGTPVTFHGTLTPHGDEAFHMVSTSSGSGMSSQMTADSKWIGACPVGVVPGDFGSYGNDVFVKQGNMLVTPTAP